MNIPIDNIVLILHCKKCDRIFLRTRPTALIRIDTIREVLGRRVVMPVDTKCPMCGATIRGDVLLRED